MIKDEDSGTHRRSRRRPVRRRIGLLLVLPLLSLVLLWSFAAATSLGQALDRLAFTKTIDDIDLPAAAVQVALQQERSAAVAFLLSGADNGGLLQSAQRATDAAIAAFRQKSPRAFGAGRNKRFVQDLLHRYEQLRPLRSAVAARQMAPLGAIKSYSDLWDDANHLYSHTVTVNDVSTYQLSEENTTAGSALDFMLREDALVAVARSQRGRLTGAQYASFADSAAKRKFMSDNSLSDPHAHLQASLLAVGRSPQFARYQELEQAIAGSEARRLSPAQAAEWRSTVPSLSNEWVKSIHDASVVLTDQNKSKGRSVVIRLSVVGGLGLLVVIASIVLSLRLARGMSRELRELQRAARELAFHRLPDVVGRLRRGERVDVAQEAPALRAGRTAEIASVAEAIREVQRTAVETAVGESKLRSGISRVFINLAWRSQSLLQRQLRMLDDMERRASDPDELENLFRLDHLTTRMRRHAEGLVILSGNENVRGWNEPVAVEQLLRAAVAEVEDYARVDVMALSQSRVVGAVAADVVHLLAELVENATAFSPPTTEVLVRAEDVGNGLAVEVADRGVGMDASDLAEVNRRLADPPEFDLADSDRLGLFVVARLAIRHGIEVTLQRSAYGGITAVALLPVRLMVPADGASAAHSAEAAEARALVASTGRAIGPAPEPKAEGAMTPAVSGGPALGPVGPAAGRLPLQGRHRAMEPEAAASPAADRASFWVDEPVPERSETYGADGSDTGGFDMETGGLPRRTRQANLVSSLRSVQQTRHPGPARHRDGGTGGDGGPADRSAEANRDLLSSLQAGWTAARDEDED